jgi:hypothetical protein
MIQINYFFTDFFGGAAAQRRPWPPSSGLHVGYDAPQSVSLLRTTHTTLMTNIHAPGGTRIRKLSRRAAALDRTATGIGLSWYYMTIFYAVHVAGQGSIAPFVLWLLDTCRAGS